MVPVTDIHCHPPLKVYMGESDLTKEHHTTRDFDPFTTRVDLPKMKRGNVKVIFATHYLPEINLKTECPNVDWLYDGIKFLAPELAGKIENGNNFNSPFEQTMQMINLFESKINEARSKGFDVQIARNYNELKAGLDEGRTVALHAIEGAHSLGRIVNTAAVINIYVNNLLQFYEKGVCLITLAHFFQNDLVPPVNGIPPGIRKLLGVKSRNLDLTITPVGESIVNKMFEVGMIVDLTHCTPRARTKVFELNNNEHPVVFSHVGVESLFNNPDEPQDKYYNPSDEEIIKIAECGGLIGILFDNYWLCGKEEKSFLFEEPGFEYAFRTIDYIYHKTGTYDNIAFGSDLDGFTDPSDDLKDCSKYPDFINYLRGKGIAEADINKISRGNVMRVLEIGWKH
jgi:microsomal dipeptidase-like Zn-dependent dipeptidase